MLIERLATLIKAKNEADAEIEAILGRPPERRHVGEYIAAAIFDIQLEQPAADRGFDGHFVTGPLAGKAVDLKWYERPEGALDLSPNEPADFYLVFTGPRSSPASSPGVTRPWIISSVYLFDAQALLREARARGVELGTRITLRLRDWDLAELYPAQRNQTLLITSEQRRQLSLFGP